MARSKRPQAVPQRALSSGSNCWRWDDNLRPTTVCLRDGRHMLPPLLTSHSALTKSCQRIGTLRQLELVSGNVRNEPSTYRVSWRRGEFSVQYSSTIDFPRVLSVIIVDGSCLHLAAICSVKVSSVERRHATPPTLGFGLTMCRELNSQDSNQSGVLLHY